MTGLVVHVQHLHSFIGPQQPIEGNLWSQKVLGVEADVSEVLNVASKRLALESKVETA